MIVRALLDMIGKGALVSLILIIFLTGIGFLIRYIVIKIERNITELMETNNSVTRRL